MNDLIIQKLTAANDLLAQCNTIQQAKAVIDMATAAEVYAKRQQLGEEAIGKAHSIKVYALQKLGEMLAATERANKARDKKAESQNRTPPPTLAQLGIDKKISSLAQKVAALPQAKVDELAAKVETINKAHVGHNTGDNEWYTPSDIIQSARHVMGGIDVDPATSNAAQQWINAREFFTADTDHALTSPWVGRIWLNPPYAQPLIGQFIHKLVNEKTVSQAIVLVNNASETEWGQGILSWCDAVCFPKGRVRFWHPEKISAPLQGQMICYGGKNVNLFINEFTQYGEVFKK